MAKKEDLIKDIIDREQKMFQTVPAVEKASCQDDIKSFRITREADFKVWATDTLESYLDDLKKAEEEKKNLWTLKYARMDNLIPELKKSPLISEISQIQYRWQNEMFEKYPNFMKEARPLSSSEGTDGMTSFETYLKAELETYSDKTLELLYKDIKVKVVRNENMTEEVYNNMVKLYGFKSLDSAEEIIKNSK